MVKNEGLTDKQKKYIFFGTLILIVLITLFITTYNKGFNSCEERYYDKVRELDNKELRLNSLQKQLEKNASEIDKKWEDLINLTTQLNDCKDELDNPNTYHIFFITAFFDKQEITFLFEIFVLGIFLSISVPIVLTLFKVNINFPRWFTDGIIISFLVLIFLAILYGVD